MNDVLKPLVLVVEDDLHMRKFLRMSLSASGYRLVETGTAQEAAQLATIYNPDLVLLDLGLPDGDGITLTRQLRQWLKAPIVVISARGRENDKVTALDSGADDYLTKPFGIQELLARMRVALRHAQHEAPALELDFGDLHLDLTRREVRRAGQTLHLTPIEYKLLALLARHAGKVLTHRQILHEVWGPTALEQPHYVRVHMAELRKKVEVNPARPQWLMTEPGVGYRLRDRGPES